MHRVLFLLTIFFISSCSDDSLVVVPVKDVEQEKIQNLDLNLNRNVYFGDLHVHTKYSFDAYILGNLLGPDEGYRFAKGEKLINGFGRDMQLKEPLDFYAITDHGVWLGVVPEYADPTSRLGKLEGTKPFHNVNAPENFTSITGTNRVKLFRGDYGKLMVTPGSYLNMFRAWRENNTALGSKYFDYDAHLSAWNDTIKAAEDNYEPGKFTTFVAYEWTVSSPLPERASYHRNVIFDSKGAPKRPFTRVDSTLPEDLWAWQDNLREQGLDSLSIPHNSNQSNGEVFKLNYSNGRPIDKSYAELRMRNEPLVEISQIKGTSETHPKLSPDDEWADFEILNTRKGNVSQYSLVSGSYVREALQNGLALNYEKRGNPFKVGFIGSTDTHNSASPVDEDNYWGGAAISFSPDNRGSVPYGTTDKSLSTIYGSGNTYADMRGVQFGASGIAAVWAEQNTREAIFAAMKRKETYGTSGNRIKLRFFAGHSITQEDLKSPNAISVLYKKAVPMGGDLIKKSGTEPSFVVWAQKDKNGAPLQRIQIVKGWYDSGWRRETREKVYDVACSDNLEVNSETLRCPDNNATVDLNNCTISANSGSSELRTIWKDPDFDPNIEAVYYVRVLENPTCRWTTWDALRAGVEPRENVPKTIQERAWSSPIWYKPN
jgi:hypothetical protein